MKDFLHIFLNSLKLPKRQAAFKLNRIGMDKVVIYLLFLLAIASIPGLLELMEENATSTFYMQSFFLLVFFFMFYYLVLAGAVFGVISLIAYIGVWIAKITSRKLRYSILWKMATCILTIPLLIFTFISFIYPLGATFLIVVLIFHFVIFIQTILLYPKRRHLK